jgi:chromate transporter
MTSPPSSAAARPESPRSLFVAFTGLALQGFGGVLAVVQRELVERRRWLTNEEFIEDWAVAQVMPGPNVVNLALMIGDRHFGLRGAAAALAGMLAVPTLLLLALAALYAGFADHPAMAGALRGMGAVAAGLIGGMALKLAAALRQHPLGWPIAGALALLTALAVGGLRVPLPWVMLALGGAACGLTWRRLAP